jgi:hypothetical protein
MRPPLLNGIFSFIDAPNRIGFDYTQPLLSESAMPALRPALFGYNEMLQINTAFPVHY